MRPFKQGDLDGLCGIYAMLNAIRDCVEDAFEKDVHDVLFKAAIDAIPRQLCPRVIYFGIETNQLLSIAEKTTRFLSEEYQIDIECRRYFENRKFRNALDFLSELRALRLDHITSSVINIAWSKADGDSHWTAFKGMLPDYLGLFDSSGEKTLRLDELSTKDVPGKVRIFPRATLSFQLVAVQGEAVT